VTGFVNFEPSLGGKWLQMLKEVAPATARVAVLHHQETASNVAILRAAEEVAPLFSMQSIPAAVHDAADIERAITQVAAEPNGGLLVVPHPVTIAHRELIIALAAQHRLPAVYAYRFFATAGGLISYGVDAVDLFRQAASYVDRILKGEKPGDLPVQTPTKFELVINLRLPRRLISRFPTSCSLPLTRRSNDGGE